MDPKVDAVDNALSEALLSDDGSAKVMVGDSEVDEGFYVVDPATVTEFDAVPTAEDLDRFLTQTEGSDHEGVSIWFDETDGRYRMARVAVLDDQRRRRRGGRELRHQPVRRHLRRPDAQRRR